jgi:hypothetical protein
LLTAECDQLDFCNDTRSARFSGFAKAIRHFLALARRRFHVDGERECGQIHRETRKLSVRMMVCDCGNVVGRDRNAAVNHYWYPEERENRSGDAPTRVEIGDQELAPVPVVEARILADVV